MSPQTVNRSAPRRRRQQQQQPGTTIPVNGQSFDAKKTSDSASPAVAMNDICHSPGRGSPFMVSGELFLRATPQLFLDSGKHSAAVPPTSCSITADNDHSLSGIATTPTTTTTTTVHPSAGLLAGVSSHLRDLLLCHPDPHRAELGGFDSCDYGYKRPGDDMVSLACQEQRSARLERIKQLKASKKIVACMVAAHLSAVQTASDCFQRGCDERRAQLNTRLGSLVLR